MRKRFEQGVHRRKKMPLKHTKWYSTSLILRNVKWNYSKVPFLIHQLGRKKVISLVGNRMMLLLRRRVSPPLTKFPILSLAGENPLPIIYSTDMSSQEWNHIYTRVFTATLLVRASRRLGKKPRVSSNKKKKNSWIIQPLSAIPSSF